ncbi:MAG: hypothetical protein B7Y43_12095 [Sphingomonas sp. 28-62-20]|nr:MAG: hypothetical protein B7Y43_12095 [Sphingomonas sp. 28-62-20]
MFGPPADPMLALSQASDDLKGPVAAILPLDQDAPRRMDATLRLWRCLSGKLPGQSRDHLTPNRRQRLTMMLRALDARTDGADRREIAQTLFGDEAVPPGVAFDDHHLRSRIARLLREGAATVAGGYRRLLGNRSRPDGS